MILVGDIGGTKANLLVVQQDADPHRPEFAARLDARAYPSLEALLADFLHRAGRPMIQAACLGVPAPVIGGRIKPANLPWEADEADLAAALHIPHLSFLNDLVATAHGIPELTGDERELLAPGVVDGGPIAVIAPGTGLGAALLVPDGTDGEGVARWRALPSEAGHGDFAPRGEVQRRLHAFVADDQGQVHLEGVCSGRGIPSLRRFFADPAGGGLVDGPEACARIAAAADPTPAIVAAAEDPAANPASAAALDLFCVILAQEAGNAALRCLATGGVFLAGGMPPRLLRHLHRPAVVHAFRSSPKMGHLLARIPLAVVRNDGCAVLGAAAVARRMLR